MRQETIKNISEERRGERGSILAVSAIGMLSFLLAVGLCVDISHFYLAKTELQNAADASALAAAAALNAHPSGIEMATDRAVQAMNNYDFNNNGVQITRANVTFAVNINDTYMSEADAKAPSVAKTIRFVRVVTNDSPVSVSFAAIALKTDSVDLAAEATAGMSVPPNNFCDWIPLSVIDENVATILPGQTYVIRGAPQNSVSPGNYQVLAVAGRGGSDVRAGIASGVDECAEAGATYSIDTKPGVNSGPVRAGINTRFDDYDSQLDPTNHPPDTNVMENITYKQYLQAQVNPDSSPYHQSPRNPGVPGRRVVIIPIIKISEYDNGRNVVTFDRFGAFFLKRKIDGGNGGDLEAEYIEDRVVVGRGGFNPGGAPGNALMAVPVLYK
ncbi:MAG: hypothetical protein H0V27_06700 [Pyrinomonadaceae bacterium]|nr:hypothetical protein [Pyrinomonadaceae bacterium]